jgi:hypothetical protein
MFQEGAVFPELEPEILRGTAGLRPLKQAPTPSHCKYSDKRSRRTGVEGMIHICSDFILMLFDVRI